MLTGDGRDVLFDAPHPVREEVPLRDARVVLLEELPRLQVRELRHPL